MPKILLIEDDPAIANSLKTGLKFHGLNVTHFTDAKHGEAALLTNNSEFDAVLLDLTLPRGDGMNILANWRSQGLDTPVMIITARDAITNRVAGLNRGADDYLVKPFALDELVARLLALIRCSQGRSCNEVRYGELIYQPDSQQVSYKCLPIEISVKELIILEQMLTHPKKYMAGIKT